MCQHSHPVNEIPENGDQFVVVAGLEILPGKIVVLGLRGIGGERVAQNILHIRKIHQVFMQPDSPVF